MLLSMRFSLPDRPGALGSVASALSHTGASIVQIVVVEREGGSAIDEACVDVADHVTSESLRRTAEAVPGVVVESIRRVDRAPDALAPLLLAERLARAERPAIETLVAGLPDALSCAWAIAIEAGPVPRVVATTRGAPAPGAMQTPWMPLEEARRLGDAPWMPPRWRASRLEVAAAPLGTPTSCVVVGRPTGMRFRGVELRQLDVLARLATRVPAPA